MNKFLAYLSIASVSLSASLMLSSCLTIPNTSGLPRIAMIADLGDIDDRSFNQGTWEGIEDYLQPKNYRINKDFKYFVPITAAVADYLASVDDAITWGAEAVICPGFLFEPVVYEAQEKYPDVKFLLEDGVPHPTDDFNNIVIGENTISIYYKEQESGFLAGYGAVHDGYKNLGYMGGMSVPAVKKFGAGFIAGSYYAANELNIKNFDFKDKYYEYLGTFAPGADVKAKAGSWYTGGTDLIFIAAGGAGASVMAAAEESHNMMIGVDVDQAYMSKTVLTSAKKNLSKAVEIFLDRVFGEWHGGEELHLGAEIDGVSLPTEPANGVDPWRFETFTKEQYHAIYQKLKTKEILAPHDYEGLKTFVNDLGYELHVQDKTFNDQK